jgi:hypothetical protein
MKIKNLFIIMSMLFISSTQAQVVDTRWQFGSPVCKAYTVCPNGTPIWCQTVSYNYGNAPATAANLCRTRVIPGQFIQCQGFADQLDSWGNTIFIPIDLPVSCY